MESEKVEPYGDILEILKADRPPRTYQEAGDLAFETEQLAYFMKDMAFLLSNEDGIGSYLTTCRTLRAFRAMSQMFNIIGVLSGNIKDWTEIEKGREFRARLENEGEIIHKD
jgi:hypothetical protein